MIIILHLLFVVYEFGVAFAVIFVHQYNRHPTDVRAVGSTLGGIGHSQSHLIMDLCNKS